jgi:Flp pilus assembly protein CpaB
MRTILWTLVLSLASFVPDLRPPPEPACGQTEGTLCIPVAARDLPPGTTLSEADLKWAELPRGFLAETAAPRLEYIVGRTLRERILADEPIREERLGDPEATQGLGVLLDRVLDEQPVALAIRPSSLGAVAPLNYVDVLVTTEAQTQTALEGVQVLDVDRERSAVVLALAEDQRRILARHTPYDTATLVLRRDGDVTGIGTHGALTRERFPGAVEAREIMARTRKSSDGSCVLIQGRPIETERRPAPADE